MKTVIGVIRIIRPLNGLIAAASLVVAIWLAVDELRFPLAALISLFLVVSFGYVINDIYDYRADSTNKRSRVLPAGILTIRQAAILAVILVGGTVAASLLTGTRGAVYFLLLVVLLFLYARSLSKCLLLSNLLVALLSSSVFFLPVLLFPSEANYFGLHYMALLFAFLFHLGREVIKDIEDMEGDRLAGRLTIPIVLGVPLARIFSAVLFLILILSTYFYYFTLNLRTPFLIVVTIGVNLPLVVLFIVLFARKEDRYLRYATVTLKLLMLPALVALVLAGADST